MGQITKITQETHNKFVNLYMLDTIKKTGDPGKYYVASRAKSPEELKINTQDEHPDGVTITMLYGEERDRIVLIRQYRYPIGGWIYELPAGLVEKGEDLRTCAVREAKEETGLDLDVLDVDPAYERAYFMTVGMVDECVGAVYGYASGEVTDKYLESSEEIEVVLADRKEARRILREERVAFSCAKTLMHFIHDEDPFAYLRESLD